MKKLLCMLCLVLFPQAATAEVTLVSIQDAVFGTAEIIDDYVLFVPKKDFYGVAKFNYTILDEPTGREATGWVFVTVQPMPEPLIAGDVTVDIDEDTTIEIPLDLILGNNNADDPDPVVTNPPASVNIPEGLQ